MEIPFLKKLSLGKGFALFKKESRVLGVDLGSASLKIIQLKKEKEKIALETYGEIATGPYANVQVGKSVRLLEAKVVEMMRDLMKEAGATAKNAVASIPLRSSFVKVISMPLISEEEIRGAMPYEVRKYIPVPTSEVIVDWQILPQGSSFGGQNKEGFAVEKKSQEVLLVAIHREAIDKYRNILALTGLNANSFEIEIFSQIRSVIGKGTEPSLIIDFGAQSTRFSIVDYGIVRLAHTVDRSSSEITESLSKGLGIDFNRAEKLKQDIGYSSRPEHKEIRNVMEPILDHIFSEGARVISEYRSRSGRQVKKAWLSGGGSMLNGLVDLSIAKLGIEVGKGQPFKKTVYPSFLEDVLKEVGPTFAVALGAAMRALEE